MTELKKKEGERSQSKVQTIVLVPSALAVENTYFHNGAQNFYVSFIQFFVFDFWSLLATKLQKYKNIAQYLFTICKARWARQKKVKRKS